MWSQHVGFMVPVGFTLAAFLSCVSQVLEVNKQWDVQWNNMKTQFEQKVGRLVWGFGFTDALEVISHHVLIISVCVAFH